MHELADWGHPALARTALAVIVAVLLLATCFKWLRLRSPDGEHWAWLLLIVQGALFASLTMYSPADWLPRSAPAPLPVPAATAPIPVDAPLMESRPAPKAVPLRLDVPERAFDRPGHSIEVFVDPPHRLHQHRLARVP